MTTQAERLAMQASTLSINKPGSTFEHPGTYISGTGTAGADASAETLKTIALEANVLAQVGDRLRVRAFWIGDTGTAITGTVKVNAVTVSHTTDAGGATWQVNETWLHYIDDTHANIIEMENGALGNATAANVALFSWSTSQDIIFTQSASANNHCVLFAFIIDVYNRGAA